MSMVDATPNGTAVEPEQPSPVITAREFRALARISESKWYELKRSGVLRGLESPIPNRYSRVKVLQWLEGR